MIVNNGNPTDFTIEVWNEEGDRLEEELKPFNYTTLQPPGHGPWNVQYREKKTTCVLQRVDGVTADDALITEVAEWHPDTKTYGVKTVAIQHQG